MLRERLARIFGPEWTGRMDEVARARDGWRAEGLAPDEVSRRTREKVARERWLT